MVDTVVGAVVEGAKAGEVEAWQELVRRHLGMVRAVCAAYGLGEQDAAEVNQVVWLRLAEHLPRIRTPDAIGGWIAATTRRECLIPRRAGGRNGHPVAGLPAAVSRLGSRCQRLLRLVATEPRPSDPDISAALDIPLEQVPGECATCLERLRRALPGNGTATPGDLRVELRRLAADGTAVPPKWWDAAHTAFGWLVLDVRSAELVYDSTAPSVTVVHAGRAAGRLPVRQVRFSLGDERVELALDTRDGEQVLSGRLTPARLAPVTVHWPGGQESAASDGDGAFRIDRLPVAPVCLQVDGSSPFKTGWIVP